MPISRPLLIVLVGAVVALAGFYATQGSRNSTGSTPVEVPSPPPAEPVAKPKAQKATTNRAVAEQAAAKAARRRERAKEAGVPPSVARAIEARKTVVILFRGSGSADDHATARAVAGLRGQRGVAVFSDLIGRLGRYRAVVGDLGISQAPAVVIVDRGRSARVVEGYIDPTTLAQDVADSR
jgi:hypothetical protein